MWLRILAVEILVDGEQGDVGPGGVADGADQVPVLADVGGDAGEVEGVAALRCVNSRAAACLDTAEAHPARGLEHNKHDVGRPINSRKRFTK